MVDISAKSVGSYLLRIISGLAVLVGILMAFSAIARGDLFGILLGVALVAGGVYGLKRSARTTRTG
jgi:hypothetical protein